MNINLGGSLLLTIVVGALVWAVYTFGPDLLPEQPLTVYEKINEVRAEHGLHTLSWSTQLAAQAQVHSDWMKQTDSFSHSGYNVFECISQGTFWGNGGAVNNWMNSPSHRAILLNPGITSCGVGIAGGYATFQAY